jgi:phosphatidylglycerophosphatase A
LKFLRPMSVETESSPSAPARKPRISLFFATAGYIGYLPVAPGTWGSLVGVALFWFVVRWWNSAGLLLIFRSDPSMLASLDANSALATVLLFSFPVIVCIAVALLGVLASSRASNFTGRKDPQFVVIDEVSGVILTLLLGLGISHVSSVDYHNPDFVGYSFLFLWRMLNWKYLLLGFILFRVFDIWKPFPARQAESLPGGWGIMADDWVAAIYAAIGIWIARALGL